MGTEYFEAVTTMNFALESIVLIRTACVAKTISSGSKPVVVLVSCSGHLQAAFAQSQWLGNIFFLCQFVSRKYQL